MRHVDVHNLSVHYGKQTVLDRIDLRVPAGSVVSVLGPSGCGKTTLVRALAGLLPIHSGSITIGNTVVASSEIFVPPERRNVGWVPQDPSLFPHLTVAENIGFGISKNPEKHHHIRELAQLVGLHEYLDRLPAQLSGGQAQRVALARALAPGPNLILLDEPFAALDPMLRIALRNEVTSLLRRQESTTLLVTHDQEEALSLSDRIAVMMGGRILQWGTPHDVYEQPATPWIARFVGSTVELAGQWNGTNVACVLGTLPSTVIDTEVRTGSNVRVVLRPEWVEFTQQGDDATVTEIAYAGHDALVTAELRDGTCIRSRIAASLLPRLGQEVGVVVNHPALVYR